MAQNEEDNEAKKKKGKKEKKVDLDNLKRELEMVGGSRYTISISCIFMLYSSKLATPCGRLISIAVEFFYYFGSR